MKNGLIFKYIFRVVYKAQISRHAQKHIIIKEKIRIYDFESFKKFDLTILGSYFFLTLHILLCDDCHSSLFTPVLKYNLSLN